MFYVVFYCGSYDRKLKNINYSSLNQESQIYLLNNH